MTSCRTYAKGTLLLLKIKALTDYIQYFLGSFNSKKVLFHLSLTVLVHYQLSKFTRFKSRFSKNKFNI